MQDDNEDFTHAVDIPVFSTDFEGPLPHLPWKNKTQRTAVNYRYGPHSYILKHLNIQEQCVLAKQYTLQGLVSRLKGLQFQTKTGIFSLKDFKGVIDNYLSIKLDADGNIIHEGFVDVVWDSSGDLLKEVRQFAQELKKLSDDDLDVFCVSGTIHTMEHSMDELKGIVEFKPIGSLCKTILCSDEENRYTLKIEIHDQKTISFTIVSKKERVRSYDCYVEVFTQAVLLFTGLQAFCDALTFRTVMWSVFKKEQYSGMDFGSTDLTELIERAKKSTDQDFIRDVCLYYISTI